MSSQVLAMNHEEYGTADDYARAFMIVIREGIPAKHATLLQAHASAPGRTASWTELAEAVGYANGPAVNLQYGRLAHRVARELGVASPPHGFWLHVLADWAEGRDQLGHTRYILRQPVVDAAVRLGLVVAPTRYVRAAVFRAFVTAQNVPKSLENLIRPN